MRSIASAQNAPDLDGDGADEELAEVPADGAVVPDEALPEPKSDHDPAPPVAAPNPPPGGVVKQAGIGGQTAYGRAGVLELGGSAGFTATDGFMATSLSPSIGWFFANNVQLSGIMGLSHISTDEDDATVFSLLVEPSYHLPFSRQMFGFMGVGFGGAHAEEAGFGFAVAPRIGANILIGRSGVLTPAVAYQYTTHDAIEMGDGTALVAVSTALSASIGYTVMW